MEINVLIQKSMFENEIKKSSHEQTYFAQKTVEHKLE